MIFLDNLYLEKSLWCSDIYDDTYIYVGIIINPLPYMVQSVSLYDWAEKPYFIKLLYQDLMISSWLGKTFK